MSCFAGIDLGGTKSAACIAEIRDGISYPEKAKFPTIAHSPQATLLKLNSFCGLLSDCGMDPETWRPLVFLRRSPGRGQGVILSPRPTSPGLGPYPGMPLVSRIQVQHSLKMTPRRWPGKRPARARARRYSSPLAPDLAPD